MAVSSRHMAVPKSQTRKKGQEQGQEVECKVDGGKAALQMKLVDGPIPECPHDTETE